jgi:hypothetical protein
MSEQFQGFDQSNTTAVPDVFFDELLPLLNGAQLKVMLYIIRRTLGFKKNTDAISYDQFQNGITTHDGKVLDKGCGVKDRTTLSKALAHLEKMNCIESNKSKNAKNVNEITVYTIKFRSQVVVETDRGSREIIPPVVGKSYQGSMKTPQGVVGKSYPQLNSNTINSETKESVVAQALQKPEPTPTPQSENDNHSQLSTNQTSTVDNSPSKSYSQNKTTPRQQVENALSSMLSLPDDIGMEEITPAEPLPQEKLTPPMRPVVKEPVRPAPAQPVAETDKHSDGARAIRRMYDTANNCITGHPGWEWEKMEEMARDLEEAGQPPTKEDMKLVYDHIKPSGKYTICYVWENWGLLPTLKKTGASTKPKRFDADALAKRSVWA